MAANDHPITLAEVIAEGSNRVHRPTFARISRQALTENFHAVKKLCAPARLMAVVKADAYGHGLPACVRLFSELGADYFGVGFLEEGVALRRTGFTEPILVLGGIVGSQIEYFLEYDLEMTASSVFKLKAIEAAARTARKTARVHLKIDTGMNRIGQNWRTAGLLFDAARECTHIDVAGLYTHFATADSENTAFAKTQIERFQQVLDLAQAKKLPVGLRHMANSAGAIRFPEARLDMIRPGLALYGQHASPQLDRLLKLTPAMSLVSEIVYLKRVRKGEGVSYCLNWTAPEEVWVATVPVGYGDGYPRHLSDRASVLVGGKRYPVVGTVCMDQLMVCLGQDHYPVGEEVVLWGRQGDAELPLRELCEQGGFIPYELPIYLTGRVPRVMV